MVERPNPDRDRIGFGGLRKCIERYIVRLFTIESMLCVWNTRFIRSKCVAVAVGQTESIYEYNNNTDYRSERLNVCDGHDEIEPRAMQTMLSDLVQHALRLSASHLAKHY